MFTVGSDFLSEFRIRIRIRIRIRTSVNVSLERFQFFSCFSYEGETCHAQLHTVGQPKNTSIMQDDPKLMESALEKMALNFLLMICPIGKL